MFSAYKASNDLPTNQMNARQAENDMFRLGIKFEKVLGVYQGSEEISYMITDLNLIKVQHLRGMAKHFDQDSILLRDNENKCHLQYFDGRPMQSIGRLEMVEQDEAFKGNAYTYSPRLKQYFVCK